MQWLKYFPIEYYNVIEAIAMKKIVSIGHFPQSYFLESQQFFLFVRLNQEQLYVLIALKIRKKGLS